jgi:hypothetical protein
MIDELVSRTFAMRDAAHREHFRTGSYARHVALGEFYTALPDAVDALVECYQGMFDLVGDFDVTLPVGKYDIEAAMQDDIDWLQATRDDTCQEDPSLLNLLDVIVSLYQRTLFKLKRLA